MGQMGPYREAVEQIGSLSVSVSPWTYETQGALGAELVTVSPPTYDGYGALLGAARAKVTAGLLRSGVLEARALCTRTEKDVELYHGSLDELEQALAALWAVEAAGATLKRVDPAYGRDVALKRAAELSRIPLTDAAQVAKVAAEKRAVHDDLLSHVPLPDAAIDCPSTIPTLIGEPTAAREGRGRLEDLTARVQRKVVDALKKKKKRGPS